MGQIKKDTQKIPLLSKKMHAKFFDLQYFIQL